MAITSKSTEIDYAPLEALWLDPKNPRLGRRNTERNLPQDHILELMRDWTLDELAVSFLESGFWVWEALLVVEEPLYDDEQHLVVVEGNRRLAALTYLQQAYDGRPLSPRWREMAQSHARPPELFTRIPYVKVASRTDISAFLGFRHVTGIAQWNPAEKAEYIAKLIDEHGLSYEEVRREIGSKAPAVRQNYITYRLLLQMQDHDDVIDLEKVEDKFSVLYLSLRSAGVRQYLSINTDAEPREAQQPVPTDKIPALASFARWMFGYKDQKALFTDSRRVDAFGKVLLNQDAVKYLESTANPSFDVAISRAGGEEPALTTLIQVASDNVEVALTMVRPYTKSKDVQEKIRKLDKNVAELLAFFPRIHSARTAEDK